jgi:hypothetical protein
MRSRALMGATLEFDTFGVGVGLAVIAGALSLVAPYLDALTVALAALAIAGWAAGRSRDRRERRSTGRPLRVVGLACAVIGAAAFFLLAGPAAMTRGFALGIALVPLWVIERRGTPGLLPRGAGLP